MNLAKRYKTIGGINEVTLEALVVRDARFDRLGPFKLVTHDH